LQWPKNGFGGMQAFSSVMAEKVSWVESWSSKSCLGFKDACTLRKAQKKACSKNEQAFQFRFYYAC